MPCGGGDNYGENATSKKAGVLAILSKKLMKTNRIVIQSLVVCSFFVSHVASAHMLASRSVSVGAEEKVTRKSVAQYTSTENVMTHIKLRGKPLSPEIRTVKWKAYGRDRKTREISVIDSRESPVDFSAGETQKLEPVTFTTTSTREHTIAKRGRGRNSRASISRIEGSGLRYVGFGIEVYEGDKLVGERFLPDRLEDELAKIVNPPDTIGKKK